MPDRHGWPSSPAASPTPHSPGWTSPGDAQAFAHLVDAASRYRDHADPPLPVDVPDVAADLVLLAHSGRVGDLLDGIPRDVIARIRAQLELNHDPQDPQISQSSQGDEEPEAAGDEKPESG